MDVNGSTISSGNATWVKSSTGSGTLDIESNQAVFRSNADVRYKLSVDFSDTWRSQVQYVTQASAHYAGKLLVQCSGAALTTAYEFYYHGDISSNPPKAELWKVVSGSYTLLQDFGIGTGGGGYTYKVTRQLSDNSIKCYKDGVQMGTTTTDSSISTNPAGVGIGTDGVSGAIHDNWEGGNI